MGKHKCVCEADFCKADGGEATIRMPKDEGKFKLWCTALFGEGHENLPSPKSDPRISAAHFPPGSLEAHATCSQSGGEHGVRVVEGALPSQRSSDMYAASKGALAKCLRLEALNTRHHQALLDAALERQELQQVVRLMRLDISQLETELKELNKRSRRAEPATETSVPRVAGIDHSILMGKSPAQVRSLAGVSSHASLEKLYEFAAADGAAEHMIFFNAREGGGLTSGGGRVKHRSGVFRGINGLFFTLMVLRTALPIVVASTLFGVHETTGGRAFTTWLNFLCRSLRPMVRLPTFDEVDMFAPDNFARYGYGKCAVVLDATEVEIPRTWQGDLNWACYSTYKGRQTAKVLVGVTPGGAICYIGPAFPGRITDTEAVLRSGLIGDMKAGGLAHVGIQLMADKGFNSISPSLVKEGILYVAPPFKRHKEPQFTSADMDANWEIANLRIHVERAIGAMKKWKILDTKFNHKQLDHIEMCFRVVASLVNMTQKPFMIEK